MSDELKKQIERDTGKLIMRGEMELKAAQEKFKLVKNEFDAAKRRLESAEVQMAAAKAIQGAATTHIVLQDLKEGNLED